MDGYIIWPEYEPEQARWLPNRAWLRDFIFALGNALRGRRTRRLRPADRAQPPVVLARRIERIVGRSG